MEILKPKKKAVNERQDQVARPHEPGLEEIFTPSLFLGQSARQHENRDLGYPVIGPPGPYVQSNQSLTLLFPALTDLASASAPRPHSHQPSAFNRF